MKRAFLPVILALALLAGVLGLLPQGNVKAGFEVRTPAITGSLTLNPLVSSVFTATGFENEEAVTLSIGGKTVTQGTTSATGSYTASAAAAQDLPYGAVSVKVVASGSRQSSYTATIVPGLSVSKAGANVGSSFTVAGNGFAASEAYTVTFTDVPTSTGNCIDAAATITNARIMTGTTTAWGSFSPGLAHTQAGTYYFVAIGQTSAMCAVSP